MFYHIKLWYSFQQMQIFQNKTTKLIQLDSSFIQNVPFFEFFYTLILEYVPKCYYFEFLQKSPNNNIFELYICGFCYCIIYNFFITNIMGCAMITPENQVIHPQKQQKHQIVVGELIIQVKSIKLEKQFVHGKTNSYVKLRMSNQQYKSHISKQNGRLKTLEQSFTFCVNSLNKIHGRMLVAEIFDDTSRSQKDVALGILDLDRFLTVQSSVTDHQQRLYLDYQTKAAGYINISIHFQPYPYETINFRINTIFIRKNTNSHRKCCVRIIIGEEIQQTSIKQDSLDSVPTWKNEQKTFIVPSFIGQATIQVIQKNNNNDELLGELTLDLKLVLSTHKPLMHNQVVYLDTKITGSIIFDTVKNKERDFEFQELISPRKSNKQIGQTKHSINTQTMTQCITDRNISLLHPPIINPKKLPPLNITKIEEFKLDKSFAVSARNYKMIEEAFEQNSQSVKSQRDDLEDIKIIEIPNSVANEQTEKIRKNSLDVISIKLIPTFDHNVEDEILSNPSQSKLNKIADSQKIQTHEEQNPNQNVENHFIAQNLSISQIDQIPCQDDTFPNQSGKYIFNEINNELTHNIGGYNRENSQ